MAKSEPKEKKFSKKELEEAWNAARREKLGWSDEYVLKYTVFSDWFNEVYGPKPSKDFSSDSTVVFPDKPQEL